MPGSTAQEQECYSKEVSDRERLEKAYAYVTAALRLASEARRLVREGDALEDSLGALVQARARLSSMRGK
jgi:hypothetical protein